MERLKRAELDSPLLTSLAQLKEQGSRLGLQDGKCPLCGSKISLSDFSTHLAKIQEKINGQSNTLTQLTMKEASLTAEYNKRRNDFQTRSLEYSQALSDSETLKAAMQNLQQQAAALKVDLNSEGLESAVREARARAIALDTALLELEGSTAFDRVAELEKQR